jgi:hypothetical protein
MARGVRAQGSCRGEGCIASGAVVAGASEMGRAVSRGGSPLQVCGGLLAASWKKTAKILVNYLLNIQT